MRTSLFVLAVLPLVALAGERKPSAAISAQFWPCALEHRRSGVTNDDMKKLVAADGIVTDVVAEKHRCVTSEEMAVAIAVEKFIATYGAARVEAERPYHAALENGVWHVSGSLPPGHRGGTAEAEIDPEDGKVLRVWHGR